MTLASGFESNVLRNRPHARRGGRLGGPIRRSGLDDGRERLLGVRSAAEREKAQRAILLELDGISRRQRLLLQTLEHRGASS